MVRPPFGTAPNWQHPLFGGALPLVCYSGWENKDWTQPALDPVTTGAATVGGVTGVGPGLGLATGSNYVTLNRSANVEAYSFTVFGVWVPTVIGGIGIAQANGDPTNINNLQVGSTSTAFWVAVGDGLGSAASTNHRFYSFAVTPVNNRANAFAVTVTSNTAAKGWVDGVQRVFTASGTASVIGTATTGSKIGVRLIPLFTGAKTIMFIGWRDGVIDDAVAQRFSAAPWEVFSPRRATIFSIPVAGIVMASTIVRQAVNRAGTY